MMNTFDALAKFGGDENENQSATPEQENNARVDVGAIINRLNELENAVNEIRQAKQTEPNSGENSQTEPNSGENSQTEPNSGENFQTSGN